MFHNGVATGKVMTLDGNYYGSEAHAKHLAWEAGKRGEERGHADGYSEGWNEAVSQANPKIEAWRSSAKKWEAYANDLQAERDSAVARAQSAYNEGHAAGHKEGWAEAIEKGKEAIGGWKNYSNKLVAEKDGVVAQLAERNAKVAAMQEQINAQQAKINALTALVDRVKTVSIQQA